MPEMGITVEDQADVDARYAAELKAKSTYIYIIKFNLGGINVGKSGSS